MTDTPPPLQNARDTFTERQARLADGPPRAAAPAVPALPQAEIDELRGMQAALSVASLSDPDTEGKRWELARRLGVVRDSLPDDLKPVEAKLREQALFALDVQRRYPGLRQQLASVPVLRLLQDDLGNLKTTVGAFDWFWRNFEAGTATNERGRLGVKLAAGDALTRVEADRLAEIDDVLRFAAGETGFGAAASQLFGQMVAPAAKAAGAGLVAGPWGAASTYFYQTLVAEGGNEYLAMLDQLRASGVPEDEAREKARIGAGIYAVGAAALETAGAKFVAAPFRAAAGKVAARFGAKGLGQMTAGTVAANVLAEYAKGVAGEVVTEGLQEALAGGMENMVARAAGRAPAAEATLGGTLERMGDVMLQTAKGMAVLGAFGPALHLAVDSREASRAQGAAETARRIAAAAEASKARQRNPAVYADTTQAAAQAVGLDTVRLDASVLAQALQQTGRTREDLAADLPGVAEQLQRVEAGGIGGEVSMTMGEFAAHVAPSPLFPVVEKHLRYGNGRFSLEEAEAWLQEFEQHREAAVASLADRVKIASDWDAQAAAVEAQHVAALEGFAKFTSRAEAEAVGKVYRLHVEQMAAGLGISPAEFQKQYGYQPNVLPEAQRPGLAQNAVPDPTDTPEFRAWFGDSKAVDAAGKPLVVYHGSPAVEDQVAPTTPGDAAALARLQSLAKRAGVASPLDVAAVLENWAKHGMLADNAPWATAADVRQAREDTTRAKPKRGKVTQKLAFDTFRMPAEETELGAHFGTRDQARSFGPAFPFFLALRNPLRLPDLGTWNYQSVLREARRRGVAISEQEYKSVFNAPNSNQALRDLLEAKGFDGVVYANEAEGEGDSYIAFRPEQVKHATDNAGTFDPNNPSFLHHGPIDVPAVYYSALRRAIETLPTKAATADGWKQALKGLVAKGTVKQAEITWSGVEQWLDLASARANYQAGEQAGDVTASRKVTREAVLAYLDAYGVRVEPVQDPAVWGVYEGGNSEPNKVFKSEREAKAYIERQARLQAEQEVYISRLGTQTTTETEIDENGDEIEIDTERQVYEIVGEGKDVFEDTYEYFRHTVFVDEFENTGAAHDAAKDIAAKAVDDRTQELLGNPGFMEIREGDPEGQFSQWVPPGKSGGYTEVSLRLGDRGPGQEFFRASAHSFGDNATDVNRLAHVRYDVRTAESADGRSRPAMFVVELQSDWQAERDAAGDVLPQTLQVPPDTIDVPAPAPVVQKPVPDMAFAHRYAAQQEFEANPTDATYEALVEARSAEAEAEQQARPPIYDAPFLASSEAWMALAWKALLVDAVRHGLRTVALATGPQLAEVFSLSAASGITLTWRNAIRTAVGTRAVEVHQRGQFMHGFTVTRSGRIVGTGAYRGERLASVLGEALAAQVLATPWTMDGGTGQVDAATIDQGAGMRSAYGNADGYAVLADGTVATDKAGKPKRALVPNVLRKLVEKIPGVTVGKVTVNGAEQFAIEIDDTAAAQILRGFPLFARGAGDVRGGFDPISNASWLTKHGDKSTVLHEMSHYFLANLLRLASLPNATPQMRQDAQTVLNGFGVKDLDAWNAMSLEEQRPHHEAWAYSAELWLFEGKTPTANADERRIFDMFAEWVRAAYVLVRDRLNKIYRDEFGRDLPVLSQDVREVFDRMVASADAVTAAELAQGWEPMLTAKPDGMTDQEWQGYQQAIAGTTARAFDDLNRESLKAFARTGRMTGSATRAANAAARKLRKRVEAEVRADVQQEPAHRARRALARGEAVEPDGSVVPVQIPKLRTSDAQRIATELGVTDEQRRRLLPVTAETGESADDLAPLLGYGSGESLVRALTETPGIEAVVRERTDARMIAEHPEAATPEAVADQVAKAVHNEARVLAVATELRFLARLERPARFLARVARAKAQDIVAGTTMRDVRPDRATQAETKARREALTALGKGDEAAAAAQKRRELVLHEQVREMLLVREEFDDLRKTLRLVFRSDALLAETRDVDHVAVARALAATFGLQPGDRTALSYVRTIQEHNPGLYAQLEPHLVRAEQWRSEALQTGRQVRDYRDLTVAEFRELRNAIEALWVQARNERTMEVEGRRLDVATVAAELVAQGSQTLQPLPTPPGQPTPREMLGRGFRRLVLQTERIEHWAHRADGGKVGAFTKYVWRPVRAAVDAYVKDRNNYTRRVDALMRKLAPTLKAGTIEFRDSQGVLRHVFGRGNGGQGMAELAAALLHIGNASNLRKLLVGRGWGTWDAETRTLDTSEWDAFLQQQVKAGNLTPGMMEFAQAVWDVNEEIKPRAWAAFRALFGYRPKDIEAAEVVLPFGKYRGGYMPAKVDPTAPSYTRIQSLADLEADFRKQVATTGRGFTFERNEDFAEPLRLDFWLVAEHIDDVLRFSHIQPAVRGVERAMQHRDVAAMLRAAQPDAWETMILPWLQRTAMQSVTKAGVDPDVDRFWRTVRQNVGLSTMFGNLPNALQQLTGVITAAAKVQPRYLMRGLRDLLTRRRALYAEIADASPMMASRQSNQLHESRELMLDMAKRRSAAGKATSWLRSNGYFLQSAFQNLVDAIVWAGAYHQATEKATKVQTDAEAHAEAVRQADAAVRMTQGSVEPSDVAGFEEGTPYYRLLTQFAGYFSTLLNLQRDVFAVAAQGTGIARAGRVAMGYLVTFGLPMLLADAITRTLRDDWDDKDDGGTTGTWWFQWLFAGQLRSALAEIPVAGPNLLAPMVGWFDDAPWNDRLTTSPVIAALERAGKGTVETIKVALADGELRRHGVRDVLTALGIAFGAPAGVPARGADYLVDVARGDVRPASWADYVQGLTTGRQGR